jgi:Microsomal signal peptidase 25 kDa subunit (SPC25)
VGGIDTVSFLKPLFIRSLSDTREMLTIDADTDALNSYIILSVLQTLYAYFIEGDVIFVGKRKTFSKRVRSSAYQHPRLTLIYDALRL